MQVITFNQLKTNMKNLIIFQSLILIVIVIVAYSDNNIKTKKIEEVENQLFVTKVKDNYKIQIAEYLTKNKYSEKQINEILSHIQNEDLELILNQLKSIQDKKEINIYINKF